MDTMDTIDIECRCQHCQTYAEQKGLTLPLRAKVNTRMHAAICTTAKGVHAMVQKAHQPPFGRMDAMQTKMGPWPIVANGMTQAEARDVVRAMSRTGINDRLDSELVDLALSVLSDSDPVFSEGRES